MKELALSPVDAFNNRNVSISEYYHASVGTSKHSLEKARECICVVEGEFDESFDLAQWQNALTQTTLANPGSYIAMHGKRRSTVWNNDGPKPSIRVVDECHWDGLSNEGCDFIFAQALDVSNAKPSMEAIITRAPKQYVIFRSLHAVADGAGVLHFMYDFFRALRGEDLIGTNTLVTDLELIGHIGGGKRKRLTGTPAYATGGPRGNEQGDCWKSMRMRGPKPKLFQKVILAIAKNAAKYSNKPCRVAMPVDLRRHCAELKSTMNYTTMVHFDIAPTDSVEDVTAKMKALMDAKADAGLPQGANVLKILPQTWIDKLLSRNAKNFNKRKPFETAVVTNIGRHRSKSLSAAGFSAKRLISVPIPGNTMISVMNMDNEITINVSLEKVYATDGRQDELMQEIESILS